MAVQTVTIGPFNSDGEWTGSVAISDDLTTLAGSNLTGVSVRPSGAITVSLSQGGFTDEFIEYEFAFTIQVGGSIVGTLPGPGFSGNVLRDTTGPSYVWVLDALPSQSYGDLADALSNAAEATILLDDGAATVDGAWSNLLESPSLNGGWSNLLVSPTTDSAWSNLLIGETLDSCVVEPGGDPDSGRSLV